MRTTTKPNQTNEKINFECEHMVSLAIQSIPYLEVFFPLLLFSSTKWLLLLLLLFQCYCWFYFGHVTLFIGLASIKSFLQFSRLVFFFSFTLFLSPPVPLYVMLLSVQRKWCDVNHIPNALPFHIRLALFQQICRTKSI